MAFDANNLIIDHIVRGIMFSTTNNTPLWAINEISDASLNVTVETQDAVNALGTPIRTFNRGKTAEFSANNSIFDLGLAAAQGGTEKIVASAGNKILSPYFLEVDLTEKSLTTLELPSNRTPKGQITTMKILNGDGTFGKTFKNGSVASATDFVHADGATTVTLPTGLKAGQTLFIYYDFEAENAVQIVNTATDFPKAGKFVMEVLGADACDPTKQIHAFVTFPNALLMGEFEWSFTTEGNHPFTIKANMNYCDRKKELFKVTVIDDDADE